MGTNMVRFLVPALVSAAILVIMIFYPLKKYFPEIAEMKKVVKEKILLFGSADRV